jgi:hypothetical protein
MNENIDGNIEENPKLNVKLPNQRIVIEFCAENRIIIDMIRIRK